MILNQRGATTKEMVVTITVMAVLCLAAVLPYSLLQPWRAQRQIDRWIQAADFKLRQYKQTNGVFPEVLDDNPAGTACQTCFSKLALENFDQTFWRKSESGYSYSPKTFFKKGRVDFWVRYDAQAGRLHQVSGP